MYEADPGCSPPPCPEPGSGNSHPWRGILHARCPGLSGKALQCCATDSFLPRKGKRDRYGVKFPQSCSASSFRAAAWLPRSASGTSLAVNVCFSALLAVGCPLPWLQGEHGDTLPVPPNRERGHALPMGCFCRLQGEALQKDPMNFCALIPCGLAGAVVASGVPPCCHHQLPQCFCPPGMCPRGAPSRGRQPCSPGSVNATPPTTSEMSDLLFC